MFVVIDNSVELNRAVPDFNLQPWHSCHKLIYVRPNPKTGVPIGHWPIPESFWPDQNTPTLVNREALWNNFILLMSLCTVGCLVVTSGNVSYCQPPRAAHPVVRFSCVDCEPMVIDKLPFDKYELEPSPLTQFILERKSPHSCWQVWQLWWSRGLWTWKNYIFLHVWYYNPLLTEAEVY